MNSKMKKEANYLLIETISQIIKIVKKKPNVEAINVIDIFSLFKDK